MQELSFTKNIKHHKNWDKKKKKQTLAEWLPQIIKIMEYSILLL